MIDPQKNFVYISFNVHEMMLLMMCLRFSINPLTPSSVGAVVGGVVVGKENDRRDMGCLGLGTWPGAIEIDLVKKQD